MDALTGSSVDERAYEPVSDVRWEGVGVISEEKSDSDALLWDLSEKASWSSLLISPAIETYSAV